MQQEQIAEVVRGSDAHTSDLPVAVIKAIRRKLRIVLAAPDMRTLRNWKSLGFRQKGQRGEITIYEDWVMHVEVKSVGGDDEMWIMGLKFCAGAAA